MNLKPITPLALFTRTLLLFFVLFSACNTPAPTNATGSAAAAPSFDLKLAKKEIEAANQRFSDLYSKGDSAGLAACYTADAKMMGPNEPPTSGRQNIQAAFAGFINAGITKVALTTVDVWGTDSLLTEEGRLNLFTKDGKQADKGKYMVLWKKEDGQWKLHRDFFNSDLPLPTAK